MSSLFDHNTDGGGVDGFQENRCLELRVANATSAAPSQLKVYLGQRHYVKAVGFYNCDYNFTSITNGA